MKEELQRSGGGGGGGGTKAKLLVSSSAGAKVICKNTISLLYLSRKWINNKYQTSLCKTPTYVAKSKNYKPN